MKKLVMLYLLLLIAGSTIAQKSAKKVQPHVKPVIEDYLKPADQAIIGGYIGERLDASYQNRVLAQDIDRLIAPFRNRTETWCWQSEFWGKWFTSAVLAYRYRPEPQLKDVLDKAVAGLMATQTPDGYIGNYSSDRQLEGWDIWGRKYCLLGLIAYYDITNDKNVLQSASRLADHLIKELSDKNVNIVTKGNHKGMAASSVLEPICQLYTRTGEMRYLDFAEEIVRQWETADGPQLITKSNIDVAKRFPRPENWYGPEQGQKAYEMMSCYEGLLELYRLTGRQEYRIAVEKTWQNILDTEINIAGSGASAECWFGGKEHQVSPVYHYQETCVTVTWIKMSQQLLRLTSKAKYADAIEQAYYNALLGAMNIDGSDWAKYTPLSGERKHGSEQCGMGLNCCNASGPRGLFTFPLTVVMSATDGIQVNFFTDGKSLIKTPANQNAEIIQSTNYPIDGKIVLKVEIPRAEEMSIRIRIPAWSAKTDIAVNGKPVDGTISGEIAVIKRSWQSGDEIELELDMRGRVIRQGSYPEHVALMRGPMVLARDARLPGPIIHSVIHPVVNKEGFVNLEKVEQKNNHIWMQFMAQVNLESYTESAAQPVPAVFCDYASAGNTIDERSAFRVWFTQLVNPRNLPANQF
jgi:uncharacterized protein